MNVAGPCWIYHLFTERTLVSSSASSSRDLEISDDTDMQSAEVQDFTLFCKRHFQNKVMFAVLGADLKSSPIAPAPHGAW